MFIYQNTVLAAAKQNHGLRRRAKLVIEILQPLSENLLI